MKTKKLKSDHRVYDPSVPITIYQLLKSGLSTRGVAKALGITDVTLARWRKTKPEVRAAFSEAKKDDKKNPTYIDYVFQHLPKDLRKLWREIVDLKGKAPGVRLEKMLEEKGTKGRQHLFLHALIHRNFNLSDACRCVNISKTHFDRWVNADPDFARLIDEMDWHRKNYFESAFFKLVKDGHPSAVIYANKTINADRGYGSKKTLEKNVNVNVNGSISHGHAILDVNDLDLPIEQKKRLLEQIRSKKEEARVIPIEGK